MPAPRVRRARCLVAAYSGDQVQLENYVTGGGVVCGPLLVTLLAGLDDYTERSAVVRRLGTASTRPEGILSELLSHGVLLEEGTADDLRDRDTDARWEWGHSARWFHYATRSVDYVADPDEQAVLLEDLARRDPPPPGCLTRGEPSIELPGTFNGLTGGLWSVLRERRTRRVFSREPLTRDQFATVMQWTWGATHVGTHPYMGDLILKTSPSGGARHPIEVYPLVLRVEGVEPGLYHYAADRHALTLLNGGDPEHLEALAVELCSRHRWVENAAVVFFMTAVLRRTAWKYPHPHAYRVILLDAGHLGQTFHLVCTQLGLAPFTMAATQDARLETALSLPPDEVPVYAALTGLPD